MDRFGRRNNGSVLPLSCKLFCFLKGVNKRDKKNESVDGFVNNDKNRNGIKNDIQKGRCESVKTRLL